MNKILVTGSNGLLGQKITERILNKKDVELVATSRGANRYPASGGYTYEELDVCNPGQIREVLQKHRPDSVVHTAAMTNVDACEQNREQCHRLNVEAVENVVRVCAELDIHLVHLSTDFIFDGEDGPYSEEAPASPVSYYGESKLMAEGLILRSSCRAAILRTIIVYGIVNDMSRSNIVLWAKSALEKGEPINVVDDQWRMPTLAEDLAECCILAAGKQAEGVFNASGKDMMSIIELVREVADFWQLDKSLIRPISSSSLNQPARRPKRTGFVLDKTIRELGYAPHSFREGLVIVDSQLKFNA